jgi:acid phosphatase type 7
MKKPLTRTTGAFGAAFIVVVAWLVPPPSAALERHPLSPGVTVTVAAAGDIAHTGSPGTPQKQTAHLITSVIHPSQVFMLGDAQYERGEYAQFLRSYDPTWGVFKNITDPVLGNHEYETPGAAGYFQYFASQLSGRGSTASDPHAGYYSFNVGDWHIVALNSNCHFANCNAQATWLRNDVASDGHMCQLVMFHDPGQSAFLSAAAASKVDLVLAGHEHRYERWDHIHGLNLRLLIVGTGGESSGAPNPRADAKFKGYGVVQLDLGPTGYSWKFIDVAGQIKDSGSDSCKN